MKKNTKLKHARQRKQIDQERAAQELQVSTSTYVRWENGQGKPTLMHLRALCTFFQMPPEELGYVLYEPGAATPTATQRDQSYGKQVL